MKLLHRMVLRALPGPFLGWLGILLFLLLMQFLIRYLPDIAGRGLPLLLIVELVIYNLAYMVVLAVPMSALLSSLLVFGRLAESRAYLVIKNSGISLMQLLWPSLIAGVALTASMMYFNNVVLPEANFRARNLWQDIHSKRPDFELQPGVFYDGLTSYGILVQEQPPTSKELINITVLDNTEGARRPATIKAERGWLEPLGTSVDLVLENGEMHRLLQVSGVDTKERYEVLRFQRYRLRLDLSEFVFERSNPREGYRSDRTTPTTQMIRFVDSLEANIHEERTKLLHTVLVLTADSSWQPALTDQPPALADPAVTDTAMPPPVQRAALVGLGMQDRIRVYDLALEQARKSRTRINDIERTIKGNTLRAARNRVEIHKKFSIALACLIFMLIGAPLGLSIRRGGLGTVGALALGIFLLYWITLVQGEKLADRGYLTPWVGMWIANIIMTMIGLWLIAYVGFDLRATTPLRRRLRRFFSRHR
ncbi:MAG: LptF/LptG family permease [Rhodothermales bacterium]